jgi:hypothetical protein
VKVTIRKSRPIVARSRTAVRRSFPAIEPGIRE